MSGVFSLIAVILSFGITALLGKWLIPFLKRINFGQTIREEGPKWHIKKDGTPTMGGIMFIIGIVVSAVTITIPIYYAMSGGRNTRDFWGNRFNAGKSIWRDIVLMAVGFGAIGFFDDYIKVVKKRNLGLTAWQKANFTIFGCRCILIIYIFGRRRYQNVYPFGRSC